MLQVSEPSPAPVSEPRDPPGFKRSFELAELAENPNQKTIRFFTVLHPRHHPRVFFGVFSFRGPSARHFVFLVQNRCFCPARPCASLATFLG